MKTAYLPSLILFIVVMYGCTKNESVINYGIGAPPGAIGGRVTYSLSSRGVSGATISTQPPTSLYATDDGGYYTMPFLPVGSYTVKVKLDGYNGDSAMVVVATGSTTTRNFVLKFGEPNGLAAYYPFNGNALDEGGNGNNATVYSAVLSDDRFGNAGHAYGFNGTGSWLEVPFSSTLFPDQFTLSVWAKFNSFPPWKVHNMLLRAGNADTSAGGDGWRGYALDLVMESITYIDFTGSDYNGTYLGYPDSRLDTNDWFHIVVVRMLDTKRMYINGDLVDVSSGLTPYAKPRNTPLMIGRNHYGVESFLNGFLDDIRIFDRALSASEIQALYNEQ